MVEAARREVRGFLSRLLLTLKYKIMGKFKFHQDVKISVWVRQTFEIEADNKESALIKAEQFKTEDVSDELDLLENNVLWDTQELLSPKDNGGECTIELYDGDTCIGRNTD